MKRRKFVEWQKVPKDLVSGGPFDANKKYDSFNPALANPDILPETEIVAPSTPQLILGEAIEHLQGKQKEVYILTMREGKSWAETGEILGISKGSVQKYKERAIKFLTQYCKSAMDRGRV
jgi:DNA-directed RNA polymerase specialized sigma24 family protein